jgi:hypothetical protein
MAEQRQPDDWARYPALRGSVFVITYGRSGSTLVQSVIQSIPGAHFTGENYLALLPLMKSVRRIRCAHDDWGKPGLAPNRPWFGADRMNADAYASGCVLAFAEHVLAVPHDARWLGFKEIRYDEAGDQFWDMLNFLRAHFPNAKFVFNSRNAAAVAKSRWWQKRDFEQVNALIEGLDAKFSAYHLGNRDHAVHLQHEDYSGNPLAFRPLFEMLDEKFDPERIENILNIRLTH